MRRNNKPKYWRVLEAVIAIGHPCTFREVKDWLEKHYPSENHTDARENLSLLTVNECNRHHYDKSGRNFRSDSGHPKDRLYRSPNKPVTYEVYRPLQHGIFDLKQDGNGKWNLEKVRAGVIALVEAEAQAWITREIPPIENECDARLRTMQSIVLRQGQLSFRNELLEAYEQQCAITGCKVLEVLEAAHIKPYMGDHTNRVDNGLLLRSDLHALFDRRLIWIAPDFTIQMAPNLKNTEYANLQGQMLHLPKEANKHPKKEHLDSHAQEALKMISFMNNNVLYHSLD